MNSRALLTCWHNYQNYGQKYYEPLLDFYIHTMRKYSDEYDKIYFLDSNWEIDPKKIEGLKAEIVRVNPHDRYYDVFKKFLPEVKEDLVLFTDNDFVIYKADIIRKAFQVVNIGLCDAAGILDEIGEPEMRSPELNGKTKFCPYFFCTRKDLLMKYRDVEWGPAMPLHETLGMLSKKMADDGVKVWEFEEDKSNILFDGTKTPEIGKNLGYYHIRSGSVPAVLLAYREFDENQYWTYIRTQPKTEYVRQLCWYNFMCHEIDNDLWGRDGCTKITEDIGITKEFSRYIVDFCHYHGIADI